MDTPLSVEDELVSPNEEQKKVPAIDDVGTAHQPEITTPEPTQPEEPAAPEKPVDKRAARLEEIAERSRERSFAEMDRTRETFTKPDTQVEAPPVGDDDKITLKVRRQAVELTVKQRNDLLAEEHDPDEIAAMGELDKNAFARRILAHRSYDEELNQKRDEVSARPQQQAQPAAQPVQPQQPTEPVKTPRDLALEKLAKADQMLAYGESVEDATKLRAEATSELIEIRASEIASQTTTQARQHDIGAAYDRDAGAGLEAAIAKHPQIEADEVAQRVMSAHYSTIQRAAVAHYLAASPEAVQTAFQHAGITPAYLQSASSENINALYRDMAMKGHRIPPPRLIVEKAADLTADRLFGSPQPQPTGSPQPASNGQPSQQPAPVDRSDRKASLHQPPRAGIPKHGEVQQPPLSEQERAKATIAEEKRKRRGIPVKR